jgi:hypothetical protein
VALKSVLESIDDLPDEIKKEYVARGDVFVLDIEDFGKHPGAVKLKTTLDSLDTKKKAAETDLASLKASISFLPEGFDEDQFKALSTGKTPNADIEAEKARHTAAVQALKDQHKTELAQRDGTIVKLSSSIENGAIDTALRNHLLEVGVEPDLLDGALAVVKPLAKAQKAEDGNVTGVVIDTDLGEVEVADFAKEWAAGKGKPYIGKAQGPGGQGHERPGNRNTPKGDFGGDKGARTQAIASKFPELAQNNR